MTQFNLGVYLYMRNTLNRGYQMLMNPRGTDRYLEDEMKESNEKINESSEQNTGKEDS